MKKTYFVGIGGIGMSALARHFRRLGLEVGGYDKTPSPLTQELVQEGMQVHFEDSVEAIPETFKDKEETLVIYTPAIPKDHPGLNFFQKEGFTVKKRAEVLADLTHGHITLAVAGTHGKTSTTSLMAHLLKTADVPFYAFLGGISANYNTNYFLPQEGQEARLMIAEADEYDRSFLRLHPNTAVITAIEPDHLDIYGTYDELEKAYRQFASQVEEGGVLLIQEDAPEVVHPAAKVLRYGTNGSSDVSAQNIRVENGKFHFDAHLDGRIIANLEMGVPGRHNIENALAALYSVQPFVPEEEKLREGISTFRGVRRRFEVVAQEENFVFIDDYAHHPTEIAVTIRTVRELYPHKKLTGVFQPHLFTRTRDLAEGFAESLSLLDEVYLIPIYPAREQPIPGITSQVIYEKLTAPEKHLVTKETLPELLAQNRPEVLLTIGAGDIDRLVAPLGKMLSTMARGKDV